MNGILLLIVYSANSFHVNLVGDKVFSLLE